MDNSREPIAIIGIGCRFPGGASSPGQFWKLLRDGKDAITAVPPDRWDTRRFFDPDPDKTGKMYVSQGGFLKEKIDRFDPLFFGISPREAECMDPQQRLLLEVAWEAFEDAGLTEAMLSSSKTGVFIGGFCLDNMLVQFGPFGRALVDSSTAASSTMTMLSNRISHTFNLTGPSITIDTACSSSLVTTHYACQALWNGECDMALSGGVNVMLRPEQHILMSKGRFLSRHGRCMSFDDRADGYTRGEGSGIVVLKKLSAARRDNDRIYALIRMTGVNQDGKTPGISMPSGDSQAALIEEVFTRAGIKPGRVQYVEAHGTGTRAGDPVELRALDRVLSQGRHGKAERVKVGSVKSLIGHLEAAAGIAGVIKTALCLHNRVITPNLHYSRPNPEIGIEDLCLEVATAVTEWKRDSGPRVACINSFGYGGTNAHMIMEEAEVEADDSVTGSGEKPVTGRFLLPLSAKNDKSLAALASKYAFFLRTISSASEWHDVFHTLMRRRNHHEHRLAVISESTEDISFKLQSFSTGDIEPGVSVNCCNTADDDRLVFIYSGMGPQWWGMGRELYRTEPRFREIAGQCDEEFRTLSGWSILEVMLDEDDRATMQRTEVAQPANFLLQIALTGLYEYHGYTPAVVAGHSVGEVSAACVSGALSLQDAVRVSYHRSRLQATTAGRGAMLACAGMSPELLESCKQDYPGVDVAAVNSPGSVTLSGSEDDIDALAGLLGDKKLFCRKLDVEVPYHSRHMEVIREELLDSLAGLDTQETSGCRLFSTVTGTVIDGKQFDNHYWWDNVRKPVLFRETVRSMLDSGYSRFLEVSPHPVLTRSIRETAAGLNLDCKNFHSLKHDTDEIEQYYTSIAELYTQGLAPDWNRFANEKARVITLPPCAWDREKYWRESRASRVDRLGDPGHIYLQNPIDSPRAAWCIELNNQYFPYLADHKIFKHAVFPAAGYVEAGFAMFRKFFDKPAIALADVSIDSFFMINPAVNQHLYCTGNRDGRGFSLYSRSDDSAQDWKRHAEGVFTVGDFNCERGILPLQEIRERLGKGIPVDTFYNNLSGRGLNYGNYFRSVRQVYCSETEVLVHLSLHEDLAGSRPDYIVHPVLLDAAFHSFLAAVPGENLFVPVEIAGITCFDTLPETCWCHITIARETPEDISGDIRICDDRGTEVLFVRHIVFRRIDKKLFRSAEPLYYRRSWENIEVPEAGAVATAGNVLLLSKDRGALHQALTGWADVSAKAVTVVATGTGFNPGNKSTREELQQLVLRQDINTVLYLHPAQERQTGFNSSRFSENTLQFLQLIRCLQGNGRDLQVIIFTTGTEAVTAAETIVDLDNCQFGNLSLCINNEFPDIYCSHIDLSCPDTDNIAAALAAVLSGRTSLCAVRGQNLYSNRIVRGLSGQDEAKPESCSISTDEPVELAGFIPGDPDSIVFKPAQRTTPAADEIELHVHYSALNYKDVLKLYGKIDEKITAGTYLGKSIGMEVSGVVTACGETCSGFAPGDKVTALVAGGLASFINVPSRYAIRNQTGIDLSASLFYINYITAYHSLINIARLESGESVLIHSAAGGVGLAAVHIAKMKGAVIHATAGSREKREYLQSIDVMHVYDSRSLDFYEQILATTDGRGVDVVLNSLAGDAMATSFRLLAAYGRFIEIGKENIAANTRLSLAEFNRNISYTSVDIDRMGRERPGQISDIIEKINKLLSAGKIIPLPVTEFGLDRIGDAVRFMAQARHTGKTVIKFSGHTVNADVTSKKALRIRGGAVYIITGGTRGLGLELAKWLGSAHAGTLVLVSRTGKIDEYARKVIAQLESSNICVRVIAADTGDESECNKLKQELDKAGIIPSGIFHAAGVYDDRAVNDMDDNSLETVAHPKVNGLVNLSRFFSGESLEFVLSFSSVSCWIGNRNQSNYIAANTFLEKYCRTMAGSVTRYISVAWGAMRDTGILSRNRKIDTYLHTQGIQSLEPGLALDSLNEVLATATDCTGVFGIDWQQWSSANRKTGKLPVFSAVAGIPSSADTGDKTRSDTNTRNILDSDHDAGTEIIRNILKQELAGVIKLTPGKIDINRNLTSLGIDSLMSIELILSIGKQFNLEYSVAELMTYDTISKLSGKILDDLRLRVSEPVDN